MSDQRITCGPFAIDVVSKLATKNGEPLSVGHRGVALLATLFKRPGEVITKSELMDAAWGSAAVEESNLTVQIAALRKVLGASTTGGDWIVTVPRVGYRFATTLSSPGSEQASIAVLPFVNLSSDPEQAFFADGLAEEIIVALGKLPGLLVIARNSSFAHRGGDVDVRQIGSELDVRYVLSGSVRRGGNRLRMSAQLADAESGAHVWAETFDRELADVFAIQDEVTRRIVGALQLKFGPAEATRLSQGGTRTLEAQDLLQRGRTTMWGSTKNLAVFERASELLRRSIEKDPDYANAYAALAEVLVLDYLNQWTADPDQSLTEARQMAKRAVQLAPDIAEGHLAASLAALMSKDFAEADRELDIAASISPSHPSVFDRRGGQFMRKGDPLTAIHYFEQAMRLEPGATIHYLHMLANAYFHLDRFETAAALLRERILLVPDTDMSRSLLVSALGHLGRADEAQQVRAELMTINPKYDLGAHLARSPLMAAGYAERTFRGWHLAGLPPS